MTKKDLAILLSPSIAFVCVGVLAFALSQRMLRYADPNGQRRTAQAREQMMTQLKSGDIHLTQEKMISLLHAEREAAELDRKVNAGSARVIRSFIGFAFSGICLQVASLLIVRKSLAKR